MTKKLAEIERLNVSSDGKKWKRWGPYVSERQWGTVREDYTPHADAWNGVTHDMARSLAYRWGEEGIAGFCEYNQILCFAPAFWNGKDSILKERLFGLTNNEGNHGEDVKELYFHIDSSPTHSYTKYLYKYPHAPFPYDDLVKNNRRTRYELEYELLDTKVFDNQEYFDCFVEYAKGDCTDILIKITVHNRADKAAELHVLPHLWYRNYWKHNPRYKRPSIHQKDDKTLEAHSRRNNTYYLYFEEGDALFCDNETNHERLFNAANEVEYVKDGINNHVINGLDTVNPLMRGSKSAVWCKRKMEAGETWELRLRLTNIEQDDPWDDFESIFTKRKAETDEFYEYICSPDWDDARKHLVRSAFGGLMWTKQFYYLDVYRWLYGGHTEPTPNRQYMRNSSWVHMTNRNVISMPDKWEYPWYAAWDLAFHTTSFARVDSDFAKDQLKLMLTEYYMHPNGQIPAYEWNFSDVNPPVHAWAVWEVYSIDKQKTGKGDFEFLSACFQKLLINFTWWVNQKDSEGTSLFEGGFLGLDNIGVFDRNHMPPGIRKMQQADASSWMGMFALNMLRMSLELSTKISSYQESAAKFFRHFLSIGWAMHNIGRNNISLWDDGDRFYYDVIQMENGESTRLKVRSLVGIIPIFAVEVINLELFENLTEFRSRANRIIRTRPDLASLISRLEKHNQNGYYLFSLVRAFRLEHLLKRLLDEDEFLSPYGIRSLSKYHEKYPYIFEHHGHHRIEYEPAESTSSMFGGNSNWRGPIWLPLNYLIIQSLKKYYDFYGPEYVYEYPTGSGKKLNLKEIAQALTLRLLKLFERNGDGKYNYHNDNKKKHFAKDEHFKDHHLFYEYFHGETGRGMGAAHQTGWTALIANLLLELEEME